MIMQPQADILSLSCNISVLIIFLVARVVELVDTRDLKSLGDYHCAGSTPAPGTIPFLSGSRCLDEDKSSDSKVHRF